MGKATGFLEHQRGHLQYRHPLERLNDWEEIASLPPEKKLQEQASRCMDCAVPFCQNGHSLAGMTTGCPIYNLIPEWNELVYQGNWKEAYERLSRTNPFPEFTGRACPAPCEGGCVAALFEDAVTIKNIERAIIDKAFENGWVRPQPPSFRTGKHVAIIGSGPAGLTCATELNRKGHLVTVYERDDRIGGLLTYGIPKMKIEQSVVDRRIHLMEEEGVRFITNVEVGTQFSVEKLHLDYDAIILCIGSTRPRNMNIPGSDLKGVHYAMDYLHLNTKSLLDADFEDEHFISATGKDVIVIGGGDTATDCVSTALRQKCKSLVQFDIYPKRSETRTSENPWPQVPIIHKMDSGQEEAVMKFGEDPRSYSTSALHFIGDERGVLKGIKSVEVHVEKNEHGQKIRTEMKDTERDWQAQLVFIAIGFEGPETQLLEQISVDVNEHATVAVPKDSYQTSQPGVFVAGDARRGQSLIVWAIQEGIQAAQQCDHYLMD